MATKKPDVKMPLSAGPTLPQDLLRRLRKARSAYLAPTGSYQPKQILTSVLRTLQKDWAVLCPIVASLSIGSNNTICNNTVTVQVVNQNAPTGLVIRLLRFLLSCTGY
jgi:hypothetical protein